MCSDVTESRPYVSAKRDAAAARKREAVIEAASQLLNDGPAMMSMEAVAKAAGVTRLTVYKQFGSRRGLLEAVFDANAEKGGLQRFRELIQLPDPRQALFACVDLMCEFWGNQPGFAKLHSAAVLDPDFAEAINARNERRRLLFASLLARMTGDDVAKRDATDLLFGATSMPMFRILIESRTPVEVANLLKSTCAAILDAHGLR
jgi:AcrR family transcriptional regulator